MAACHEYYHCCIAKDKKTTGLMVAVDATCSGLQILAGLARDESTAELVNVVPSSKPSDAYKAVAEKAKEFLPTYMQLDNRSVCKRTVMTYHTMLLRIVVVSTYVKHYLKRVSTPQRMNSHRS